MLNSTKTRPSAAPAFEFRLIPLADATALLIRRQVGRRVEVAGYWLREIPCDIGGRAFELVKGDASADVYHVRVLAADHAECDCKGHERWGAAPGGRCKHARAILALIARGELPENPCGLCGDPVQAPTAHHASCMASYAEWSDSLDAAQDARAEFSRPDAA